MSKRGSVLIIGAGFSGLSAAHHLSKAGFEVEVREASPKVGGLISSVESANGLFETAANGILNSQLVEELFAAANVEMIPTKRESRARFIVRNGSLHRWPLTFRETLGVLKAMIQFFRDRSRLAPLRGESVHDWGIRNIGARAAKYSIETALQGIYAGDPTRLSASLILGRLFVKSPERKIKPKFRGTVSAKKGMGELLVGLKRELTKRGVILTLGAPVTPDELVRETRTVVVATGAKHAAQLLTQVDPARSALLKQIELLPIISVSLILPFESFPKKGFGYLFAPGNSKVLGVLMNNWIFSDRTTGQSLSETWILGGAFADHDLMTKSDQEILNLVREQRLKLGGKAALPIEYRIQRWPEALPHITTELEQLVPSLNESNGKIFLLGNYTGGIGLAKILEQAANLPMLIRGSKS